MNERALARERCEACTSTTPRLTEAEIAELRASLEASWQVVGGTTLRREYRTPDFAGAFSLATAVAQLAEAEGHHPDLEVAWGRLVISITTHAIRALSRNDFILATKIDAIELAATRP